MIYKLPFGGTVSESNYVEAAGGAVLRPSSAFQAVTGTCYIYTRAFDIYQVDTRIPVCSVAGPLPKWYKVDVDAGMTYTLRLRSNAVISSSGLAGDMLSVNLDELQVAGSLPLPGVAIVTGGSIRRIASVPLAAVPSTRLTTGFKSSSTQGAVGLTNFSLIAQIGPVYYIARLRSAVPTPDDGTVASTPSAVYLALQFQVTDPTFRRDVAQPAPLVYLFGDLSPYLVPGRTLSVAIATAYKVISWGYYFPAAESAVAGAAAPYISISAALYNAQVTPLPGGSDAAGAPLVAGTPYAALAAPPVSTTASLGLGG